MMQSFWWWHWPWYPLLPFPSRRGDFQDPLIWFGDIPSDRLGGQGMRKKLSDVCSQSGF
jgi:hypothetical protein